MIGSPASALLLLATLLAACAPPASVLEPARASVMPPPVAGAPLPLPALVTRTGGADIALPARREGGQREGAEARFTPTAGPRSGPAAMP